MRFDTSQQMRMGQQMRLAPRMIQSMEILQLPLQALEERIEQELESNATLETYEPGGDEQALDEARREQEREDTENERPLTVHEEGGAEDFERLDSFEQNYTEAVENEAVAEPPRPRVLDDLGPGAPRWRGDGDRDAKLDAMANTEARAEPLVEQLLEQWAVADVDDDLRDAGRMLIGQIDDDGYIRTDLKAILEQSRAAGQGQAPGLTPEALERALLAIHLFLDPPGIGARDARECLLLQIDALLEDSPALSGNSTGTLAALEHARKIVEDHWDDLVHNRIPRIAEKSGLSVAEVTAGLDQLRRLTLHPGRRLINTTPPNIIPDAVVEWDERDGCYRGYVFDGRLPHLRINRDYVRMARDRAVPTGDRQFIRTGLSNAQWLMDAVRQRRQTLQRVLNVVVEAQKDFFDQGPQALRPLPMTQVADQLGIHVATVSRAVAGKHVQTPRGIFPLRKFFSGGTQTEGGEEVAWEAVRAALQEVVDAEDKAHPLSDEALVDALKQRGLDIARRTVAKYRAQLEIPPARLRKTY